MPLLEQHRDPDKTTCWGIWQTTESPSQLLEGFAHPTPMAAALSRFKADGRKAEWLAVRRLLAALLATETAIAYRANGAPYLPEYPDTYLSISHTNGYAAVLLTTSQPAGIDIERRSERICRIRDRFLNDDETRLLHDADADQLLVGWCAKEAVFKTMPQPVADFQRHITLLTRPIGLTGTVQLRETFTPDGQSFSVRFDIRPHFVLAIVESLDTQ